MAGRVSVFAAATLAVAAFAGPAGAGNPQLAGLQVALRAYGLYNGPVDAISGPQTRAAVKAFQRRVGLPADGLAGRRTRLALGPLGRPLFGTRLLRLGCFGWDVSVLQFLLHRLGVYNGPYDAYYDRRTEQALRRYQRTARLAADGIAGTATAAALVRRLHVPVAARVVPVSYRVYRVRPGDSLTALAARFRTTLAALARANDLDPARVLLIGTRLRLPAAAPASAPSASPSTVQASLTAWAQRYGIDPALARALSFMESGFQTDVVSPAGASGPLQVMPTTWTYVETVLLHRRVPHTADGNVRVGLAYLKHLLTAFGGDERLALAAWYQGEQAVRRDGIYAASKPFVADVLALERRV